MGPCIYWVLLAFVAHAHAFLECEKSYGHFYGNAEEEDRGCCLSELEETRCNKINVDKENVKSQLMTMRSHFSLDNLTDSDCPHSETVYSAPIFGLSAWSNEFYAIDQSDQDLQIVQQSFCKEECCILNDECKQVYDSVEMNVKDSTSLTVSRRKIFVAIRCDYGNGSPLTRAQRSADESTTLQGTTNDLPESTESVTDFAVESPSSSRSAVLETLSGSTSRTTLAPTTTETLDQATEEMSFLSQANSSLFPTDQTTTSHLPSDQTTTSQLQSDHTTSSHLPSDQTTTSQLSSDQTTTSKLPSDQTTSSHSPSVQTTTSHSPSDQTTTSHSPSDQTTTSHSPSDQTTTSHSPSDQTTTSHSPSDQNTTSQLSSNQTSVSTQSNSDPLSNQTTTSTQASNNPIASLESELSTGITHAGDNTSSEATSTDSPIHFTTSVASSEPFNSNLSTASPELFTTNHLDYVNNVSSVSHSTNNQTASIGHINVDPFLSESLSNAPSSQTLTDEPISSTSSSFEDTSVSSNLEKSKFNSSTEETLESTTPIEDRDEFQISTEVTSPKPTSTILPFVLSESSTRRTSTEETRTTQLENAHKEMKEFISSSENGIISGTPHHLSTTLPSLTRGHWTSNVINSTLPTTFKSTSTEDSGFQTSSNLHKPSQTNSSDSFMNSDLTIAGRNFVPRLSNSPSMNQNNTLNEGKHSTTASSEVTPSEKLVSKDAKEPIVEFSIEYEEIENTEATTSESEKKVNQNEPLVTSPENLHSQTLLRKPNIPIGYLQKPGVGIDDPVNHNLQNKYPINLEAAPLYKSKRNRGIITFYRDCVGIPPHDTEDHPCIFPFIYLGKVHTACTTMEDHLPWCATEVDPNRHLVSNNWGYCTAGCPIETRTCKTVVGGPIVNVFCRFPFRYKGVQYHTCTNVDDPVGPWCATQVDNHGDYMADYWGRCECPDSLNTTISGERRELDESINPLYLDSEEDSSKALIPQYGPDDKYDSQRAPQNQGYKNPFDPLPFETSTDSKGNTYIVTKQPQYYIDYWSKPDDDRPSYTTTSWVTTSRSTPKSYYGYTDVPGIYPFTSAQYYTTPPPTYVQYQRTTTSTPKAVGSQGPTYFSGQPSAQSTTQRSYSYEMTTEKTIAVTAQPTTSPSRYQTTTPWYMAMFTTDASLKSTRAVDFGMWLTPSKTTASITATTTTTLSPIRLMSSRQRRPPTAKDLPPQGTLATYIPSFLNDTILEEFLFKYGLNLKAFEVSTIM